MLLSFSVYCKIVIEKVIFAALLAFVALPLAVLACLPTVVREMELTDFTVYNAECNATAILSATVTNNGDKRETSVLRFFVDGREIWDCTRIVTIDSCSSITGSCEWKTVAGTHKLKAMVEPLTGEDATDNEKSVKVNVFCCEEGFLDEFRCFYNWKQQKYQYADCRTEWRNVGYCETTGTVPQACTPMYLEEYRCSDSWLQRKYQRADCSVEWVAYTFCEYGCSDNVCVSKPYPLDVNVVVPSDAFTGDTKTIYIYLTNRENRYISVNGNVYLCSEFCWLMPCNVSISIQPNSTYILSCSYNFQKPGVYQAIVDCQADGIQQTFASNTFSVSNVRPAVYTYLAEEVKPFLILQQQYPAKKCENKTISFEILNSGNKPHTFSISIEGYASKWLNIPQNISVAGLDKKTVYAYLSVPCDVEDGVYEFSLRAKDTEEFSKVSAIIVSGSLGEEAAIKHPVSINLSHVLFFILLCILLILAYKKPNTRREPEYFKGDC